MKIDVTQQVLASDPHLDLTPEERAECERLEAEYRREWEEWEQQMARCQQHFAPDYNDPEGDGCPGCGWGAK